MADTTISGLTLTTPTPSFLLPCSDGSTTYSSCISSMFLNMGNKYINVFGNSNEFNTGTGLVLRNSYSGHGFTCIYFGNDASFNAGAVWQGSSNYTYYAGPSSMNIGTLINSPLGLVAGNSVRMFITSGGNVGVGTSTPQARLDVNGNMYNNNLPMYGVRAWVRFSGANDVNGTASSANTDRQIFASGNVTRVTRTSLGNYDIYLATPFPNTNYSAVANIKHAIGYTTAVHIDADALTAGIVRTWCSYQPSTVSYDPVYVDVWVIG